MVAAHAAGLSDPFHSKHLSFAAQNTFHSSAYDTNTEKPIGIEADVP
jgi:hypothetical protein